MKAGRGEATPPAGGPARHIPVLLNEAVAALGVHEGGAYLDATFGAGGYSRAILAQGGKVLALDRDPAAIAAGRALAAQAKGRLTLVQGRFGALDDIALASGFGRLDGVVLDVGLSSMQVDEAGRGFSFRNDAPLDMRMESAGRSAADILAEEDEATIADILYYFGEERAARRIARAIVADRKAAPFVTTRQLASLIERVAPARPGEATHPATRSFQALRIAVNDELGELARGLSAAERRLASGGKLIVVTFHSLEDRIVKQFFARRSGRGETAGRRLPGEKPAEAPTFIAPPGQPVASGEAERLANPRARSAKLRWGVRTEAAPRGLEADLISLTHPELALMGRS
jgi:16S rRNA (cytosine1402-N4)-methyltransferase